MKNKIGSFRLSADAQEDFIYGTNEKRFYSEKKDEK